VDDPRDRQTSVQDFDAGDDDVIRVQRRWRLLSEEDSHRPLRSDMAAAARPVRRSLSSHCGHDSERTTVAPRSTTHREGRQGEREVKVLVGARIEGDRDGATASLGLPTVHILP
jgi:hypothetical protein